MAFKTIDEIFDPRLHLPWGGKIYHIPEPDAQLGLFCQRLFVAGYRVANGEIPAEVAPELQMDDEKQESFNQRLLGSAYEDLERDGVGWPVIKLMAETVFFWIAGGLELAEHYWESAGDPKALSTGQAPRAVRRAAAKSSRSTDAVTTTKPRGSTSGTKSPRKTASSSPSKPPRSPGK